MAPPRQEEPKSQVSAGVAGGLIGLFIGMGIGGMLVMTIVAAGVLAFAFWTFLAVQEQIEMGGADYEDADYEEMAPRFR